MNVTNEQVVKLFRCHLWNIHEAPYSREPVCKRTAFSLMWLMSFPGGSDGKECLQCGDLGSIPGSGTSLGERNGNPLQYSFLENSTEEPGRYSPWGGEVGQDWATNCVKKETRWSAAVTGASSGSDMSPALCQAANERTGVEEPRGGRPLGSYP